MAKKILIPVAVILVVLLIYAGVKSPDYSISREISIKASPEKIFPYLNNSKLAQLWGPWSEVDPQAKMSFSGPEEGVGSTTSWDSSGQLGTGSATISESTPLQSVVMKLAYTKPMTMNQDSVYLIKAVGDQSTVIWKVTGQNNFMGRLMCLFMDMDKTVGPMFEKGLLNLKSLVEKNP